MDLMRIAIATDFPGGLNAKVSSHFGECDIFTIVEIVPKNYGYGINKVELIPNKDHLNCGIPILKLKKAGANIVIVQQIGKRPFEILQKEKIPVYIGNGIVRQVIQNYFENRLFQATTENICVHSV
ncbi:MAG: NifB/NifX family molybdenum-iron cluster-binding protein [Candidatus Helarchaeota archaeon]